MENNNKESFTLLGMSDSGSDSGSIPEFVVAPRKRKVRRRVRGASGPRLRHTETCTCKGRTVGLSLAVTLLLCWLVVLTWLAVVLHSELKRLDSNVHSVVAGNQGVPEDLQECHSLSRGLQQNQTLLFVKLEAVETQLGNFSAQLAAMQHSLHEVQDKLKAAPELVNVPQDLEALKGNVANFGSRITDFESTLSALKTQTSHLQEQSEKLVTNLTNVKETVTNVLNASQQSHGTVEENIEEKRALLALTNQLSQNITRVNDTLNSRLQWIVDDQKKDHKELEIVQELGQNISARITTVEGECSKVSAQTALLQQIGNITEQIASHDVHIHQLSNGFQQLQSNNSQLNAVVNNMQESISQLSFKVLPTSGPTAPSQTVK